MSALKIRKYGDPVLREKSRSLEKSDLTEDFFDLIEQMKETMYEASGIGLAANQVGETRRFFVADWEQAGSKKRRGKRIRDEQNRNFRVFLNPEVIESSPEDDEYLEGCLSIPGLEGDVFRPTRIRVKYRDLDWEEHEEWLDELGARVFQHELDHLDGVLFIDLLPKPKREEISGALNKVRKETLSEIEKV